jgi:asparagine synthase (glutamine-hydrolysing)
MCGIAGFIDSTKETLPEAAPQIGAMLSAIAHRGPDNSDFWHCESVTLGHNRLSIIDLSDEANQPFHRGELVIVYNGEVYNYIELREELANLGHGFHTQSDTEVILAAYEQWGGRCVGKFIGMWAFAIWDKRSGQLFCSRDRFGIKPFYYIAQGGRFYFASEIKALKMAPIFQSTLNQQQVNRYLRLGWVGYFDESLHLQVMQLPAAHNLTVSTGKPPIVNRYWDVPPAATFPGSWEEKVSVFRELFVDSVRLQMRSDVPVGGCLSGGLDSSSIASVVGRHFSNIDFSTYTIFYSGAGDVDERPHVAEVLRKYPNLKPHFKEPTDAEIESDFENFIRAQDGPVPASSPFSQYFVMKLARADGAKVLLDGQGSDEYLAGYRHANYRLIGKYFTKLNWLRAAKEFSIYLKNNEFGWRESASRALKSVLAGGLTEQQLYAIEYKNYFPDLNAPGEVPFQLRDMQQRGLNSFLYHQMFATSLPTLLHYEDRNSMAFSIESREPFLDHRLVELAFSLPAEDKIRDGWSKYILRQAMQDYLPEKITFRRDKKGFVTPGENKWLRQSLRWLLDWDYRMFDGFDIARLKKINSQYRAGDNSLALLVWRLSALQYWMKGDRS